MGKSRPILPVSLGRCGRWRDHRQMIDGTLHPARTGVQWRNLRERFGPWQTRSPSATSPGLPASPVRRCRSDSVRAPDTCQGRLGPAAL
ncbi:transposase [Streptomyces coeruleorubidus]|uniref:transposase n=1 Tax=Streptomyces coeruleorubidus TaxID=116188 RepID=UPI0033C5A605